jgi:hypothetical protein
MRDQAAFPEWQWARFASEEAFEAVKASLFRFLHERWESGEQPVLRIEKIVQTFIQARTRNHDALDKLRNACEALLAAAGRNGRLNNDNLHVWEAASTAFYDHLASWQPMMDAVASLVSACLAANEGQQIRDIALPALMKKAQGTSWPGTFEGVRRACVEHLTFYHDELRPMRNNLVHNNKVVAVYPHPIGRLAVEIVTPGEEDDRTTYDLAFLVGESHIRFHSFAVGTKSALYL